MKTNFCCNISEEKDWTLKCILNLFIVQNGKVSPGFPVFCLFDFAFVRHPCSFSGWFATTICGYGAFSWGFPSWEIGWNFCNFCILCSRCHYLLCFISLFICYYYYYHFFFLVGIKYTHPFLLMWAIVNLSWLEIKN